MTRIINKEESQKQFLKAVDVVCMDCAFFQKKNVKSVLLEKLLTLSTKILKLKGEQNHD